ncbi:MAG TPA: S16 family serine protease [Candidatus Nanoarchaeia archaeon]|nr:S16 family serine protease [Candidatus Nanoarchaeia archaeon]
MKKIIILLLILNLILLPSVLAKQGHMKLLAVKETETGMEGGVADLYLEIVPGSGRVFLETFPLTKTDTQMSTRFAKAMACDLTDKECNNYDFFYTITADSSIIAGPSAGASIAVLTVAMLENFNLNENYAITGTINSGGLIGPVGGLKAKVEGAKKAGLKKVFIPAGEIIVKIDNETVDLKNLSKSLGIEIAEISTLDEAVKEFTGHELTKKFKNIEIDEQYRNTMKSLAKSLCDRSSQLKSNASKINYPNASLLKEDANNLTLKGKGAFEKQTFYSSASYCFGANVEFSTLLLLSKNLSKNQSANEANRLKKEINEFRNRIDSVKRKTITDLEAYIVVKERLSEAEESANAALEILNKTNRTEIIARNLAYSSERIKSADSWSQFLGKGGREFNLDKDILKKSCQAKISEADERAQYVELYFPGTMGNVRKEIDAANSNLENGDFEICLSTASRAKADVDVILSVFGVDSEQYKNLVERKLDIVKNNIAEETTKGIFPILSYSYYEYANSLKDRDVFSALIYSEYALELGDLDIYFKENSPAKKTNRIDRQKFGIFLAGVVIGVIAVLLIRNPKNKPSRERKVK